MSRTPQDRLADIRDSAVRAQVARLRDLLAHHYYRVDPLQIIRRTVDAPLRDLQVAAGRLMNTPNADRG